MIDPKKILQAYIEKSKDILGKLEPEQKKEGERKLSICIKCPEYNAGFCKICLCYMPAKVLIDEKCPLNKF